MFKVLVTDGVSKEGIRILEDSKSIKVDEKPKVAPDELKKIIGGYDALIVRSATKVTGDIIAAADKLKIVGRAGVGLDNVDLEAASKKGIIVMNAPAGNTVSTAEHTFSLILALSRNVAQANQSMKHGRWERGKFMGVQLYGKTLGIMGLGRIGSEVARRALSFDMKIIAYDPYLSQEKAQAMDVKLVGLDELLKTSDYITVHTPLTPEAEHMIGEKEFRKMKKGVRIVNCARGGIIDEKALLKAIEAGIVGGAALDVFEEEPPKDMALVNNEKVVATPHLGASTEEAQVAVAVDIAESVKDALLGCGIKNAVNIPCLDVEITKALQPYLNLCEKLGLVAGQLLSGQVQEANISYHGDIVKHQLSPLTLSIIKGLLTPLLGETVNYVNAMVLAKERGIRVNESKTTEVENYANLISLSVKTSREEVSVAGSLFTAKDARIVKINNFYVEAIPSGCMLIISNIDKPGIIGEIGTLLGKNKINIASMTFGRQKPGGRAITVLNVDCAVDKKVLDGIKKAKNVTDVRMIRL